MNLGIPTALTDDLARKDSACDPSSTRSLFTELTASFVESMDVEPRETVSLIPSSLAQKHGKTERKKSKQPRGTKKSRSTEKALPFCLSPPQQGHNEKGLPMTPPPRSSSSRSLSFHIDVFEVAASSSSGPANGSQASLRTQEGDRPGYVERPVSSHEGNRPGFVERHVSSHEGNRPGFVERHVSSHEGNSFLRRSSAGLEHKGGKRGRKSSTQETSAQETSPPQPRSRASTPGGRSGPRNDKAKVYRRHTVRMFKSVNNNQQPVHARWESVHHCCECSCLRLCIASPTS